MAPSRFGREVVGDPRLVSDLRRGRQLRLDTEARVRGYLSQLERAGVGARREVAR